jgi:hypothetical protein
VEVRERVCAPHPILTNFLRLESFSIEHDIFEIKFVHVQRNFYQDLLEKSSKLELQKPFPVFGKKM